MKTYRYRLSFTTPAFLGNASQQAQWRTPPIKALLRQWWRVAVARQMLFNVDELRRRESDLFGAAADDGGVSHQSRIRLRLSHWNMGQLKDWPRHGTVKHPEVSAPVGSDLYLGFGPLKYDKASRSTAIKAKAAIQAGDSASFSLVVPEESSADIETALWLMDRFGALGGRSRNGWGSFSLQPADDGTAALEGALPTEPWQDALQLDWPHAIGTDAKGALVWKTAAFDDWKKLMQELAQLKINLRTQFLFPNVRPDGLVHNRHWLSYPVTTHKVANWDKNNARLPNSLRFKVRPAPGNSQQLVGVMFHVPCKPPPVFDPDPQAIKQVWKTVHAFLDQPEQKLTRIPA